MDKLQLKSVVLSMVVASALAACGGGGGGGVGSLSGTVFDGKVTNATVFCDTNDNGTKDAGEASTATDANGNFTLTGGCSSPVVAVGGTNTDTGKPFLGKLKASASSTGKTFVTPLTTVMKEANLTAAQVATAFSLPANTDPTQVDPATNVAVYAATATVQQVIQKTAETIAAAGGQAIASNATTTSMTQNLYALIAKEVSKILTASPLVANSIVVTAVVQTVVTNSMNVAKNDTGVGLTGALANVPTSIVANAAAGAIASQATTLAASNTLNAITANVNLFQPSTSIATGITTLLTNGLLVAGKETQAAAFTAAITQAAQATTPAQQAAATAAFTAAATTAGVTLTTAPSFAPTYLAIANDTVTFNDTSFTLANFKSPGVTMTAPAQGSLDTVGFSFSVSGTPFTNTTAMLGLEVKDANRTLQMVIDQVNLTLNAGQVTASIPANAKLYIYGKKASGTTANITLTNMAANTVTVTNNAVSWNAGPDLDRAIAAAGSSDTVFSNIRNAKGTFDVKFALTNVDLYTGASTATPVPADAETIQVTNTSVIATGKGAAGKVTVQ